MKRSCLNCTKLYVDDLFYEFCCKVKNRSPHYEEVDGEYELADECDCSDWEWDLTND